MIEIKKQKNFEMSCFASSDFTQIAQYEKEGPRCATFDLETRIIATFSKRLLSKFTNDTRMRARNFKACLKDVLFGFVTFYMEKNIADGPASNKPTV